jgi:DNA repair protein RecN (Recombination protein N)
VVLLELRIENLLLIERAELRPGPGLTAITGETGAGKTVLAHALDLLLGGKPRSGIVRPGAREAYVEGVFELPLGLLEEPELGELRERVGAELEDGEAAADGSAAGAPVAAEIVLARRVGAGGRTRAFVQGRSATAADLQVLGGRLLAFFGQHEHRRLTLASAQLELLDGFCGRDHLAVGDDLGRAHAQARELERRVAQLRERAGTRDRDLDLLAFEIEEIDALGPTEQEKESLLAERERLRAMDGLLAAAGGGAEAIAPEGDGGGVADGGFGGSGVAGGGFGGSGGGFGGSGSGFGGSGCGVAALLGEAERLAGAVQGVDPELDELAGRLAALRIEAEDLGGELRRYADSLEAEPGRLQEVEERLEAYERLERKHGGSVAAVVAHAERCRAQRHELEQAEVATERAEAELAAALERRDDLSRRVSESRSEAAPRLADRVRDELAVLAMEGASFEVRLEPRDEIGPVGAERVELMLAPNPGVPAAPIREAASGGELSRVMLALMTVAGAGESRSLVFDEVDAGVGGQTARAVGERLRALGETRQVLCITHLAQIAALATSHFRIEKSAADDTALTTVEEIAGDGVVEELVRMLGAESSDGAARRHAEELLAAA